MARVSNGSKYDRMLGLLANTMKWCNGLDVEAVREFVTADDGLPRVFVGSGGSLSAAFMSAQLSVDCGMAAVAMTPYQYIFSGWSKIPARVLILSASGRNVDAINAYRTAHANKTQRVGALIFTPKSKLGELMKSDGEDGCFVYNLLNSDGFLATNSLLAFYMVAIRSFNGETVDFDTLDFGNEIRGVLEDFLKMSYSLCTDSWDDHNAAVYEARETDRFYVLYSADTQPVAIDLESRFSEGSIGCLQISDYRNFAHGRFNWFHQRKGQTGLIALVSPEGREVAENILSEIPDDIPVMRVETNRRGAKGLIDLLVKGMYLAKYMGTRWGMDIGAPDVAQFGKTIHSKDFIVEPAPTEQGAKAAVDEATSRGIDDAILGLPIGNMRRSAPNIVCGETLWTSRNKKYVGVMRDMGVECVVDLREGSTSTDGLREACEKSGLEYRHFPIGVSVSTDSEVLKALPEVLEMLDQKNCYVSCQQGLAGTDTLLAMRYMFGGTHDVPILRGHIKDNELKCDDVMRRLRSMYKVLSETPETYPGLEPMAESVFRHRRKLLLNVNRKWANADQQPGDS